NVGADTVSLEAAKDFVNSLVRHNTTLSSRGKSMWHDIVQMKLKESAWLMW
ncbi:hypothetical protein COCCADRAFT_91328, partial [Bipolaris zeicola 26-R-13]